MDKRKILIVEDELIIALDLKHCFLNAGFKNVKTAASGETAIDIASKVKPDVALLDINLAGEMDGLETAKFFEEENIPVVFITAQNDPLTIAAIKATGKPYLIKPVCQESLIQLIFELLSINKSL